MRKNVLHAILLLTLAGSLPQAFAETIDVRLRISQQRAEGTITRENLIKIKKFILQQGRRETYSNAFSNNPAYHSDSFRFYLDPDSGQENSTCDPEKSDFHILTIRRAAGGSNQYRTVEFLDRYDIYITSTWPTGDLSVQQIRQFVEDAMRELLAEIDAAGQSE